MLSLVLDRRALAVLFTLFSLTLLGAACGARDSLDGVTSSADDDRCALDGRACELAADCCSGSCERGVCGRSSCAEDGASCASDEACCSLRCGDDGRCESACRASGQSCTVPSDCCSLQCAGGACVDGCATVGDACQNPNDCCSGNCSGGRCVEPCVPNGLGCDTPGECCSLVCNAGVCGGCIQNGALCTDGDSCCSGICAQGVCAGPCQPNGAACQAPADCCSGGCNGGVCGPACVPDGVACDPQTPCCAGVCESGFCGAATCSHGECETGDRLSPACSPCVANVCAADPFCCQVAWDDLCVDGAAQICGSCGSCTPNGLACNTNTDCCSANCDGGLCAAPMGCPHGPCELGPPLLPGCSSCTAAVCGVLPSCCQTGWTSACVAQAEQSCGLDCGGCNELGTACNVGADCCSGTCTGGVCADACAPDGSDCSVGSDCCSQSCNGGVCGAACAPVGGACGFGTPCCSGTCVSGTCAPVACPSDGSACGNCIAGSCCGQLLSCLTSPGCIDDIQCFIGCASGGSPATCLFQCVDSPQAFQALTCIGINCAGACL